MKLNYKRTIFVGFAFFLIMAFWQAYDAIMPLILVNKFGLSQTASGVVMALDNILAVFLLPLFGMLSDKSKSKYGKRTPYIVIGTIVAIAAFIGLSFADNAQLAKLEADKMLPAEFQETLFENYGDRKEITNAEKFGSHIKDLPKDYTLKEYISKIYGEDKSEDELKECFKGIDEDSKYYYKIDKDKDEIIYTVDIDKDIADKEGYIEANAYNNLVLQARSLYVHDITIKNPLQLIFFIIILLVILLAMSSFRSPAVALMPDVTIKPLRSQANAIINLMGTFGGMLVLVLGIIFGTGKIANQSKSFMGYIFAVCAIMAAGLTLFITFVREPKWAKEANDESKRLNIDENEGEDESLALIDENFEEDKENYNNKANSVNIAQNSKDVSEFECGNAEETASAECEGLSPDSCVNIDNKAKNAEKSATDKGKFLSLILLLLSVGLWYMGYNAAISKYSLYATNVLQKDYNTTLLVAQAAAIICYLPAGWLSAKIGRKYSILSGITLLVLAFTFIGFCNSDTNAIFINIAFSLGGIGWATINVNSFPMVVELSQGGNVGKYTGFYYTASMAAQIITPVFSGVIMDMMGSMQVLFPYCITFIALSFVSMLFVRHGDNLTLKNERKRPKAQ